MIAINENKSGWKFIEPVLPMIEHLKKILPQEIIANEKKIFDLKVPTQEEQMEAMMEIMKASKEK